MNLVKIKNDKNLRELLKNPKFSQYFDFLIEKNKVTNLTNIVEETEVYDKHFYDSVVLSQFVDLNEKSILDIGSGAGFPSIPLKIINDSLQVTIIDSLNKRINFLKDLMPVLELNNVELIHGRVEETDKSRLFDIVTARAVARLNILAELSLPYVKHNGYFVAFKSIHYQEELDEAKKAITVLGGKVEQVVEYEINKEIRHVLIFIKKVKNTPNKYPRIFSKIKSSPL